MKRLTAYKDGKRLVIVLEDADASIEQMVMNLLAGEIKQVDNLAEPAEAALPKFNAAEMLELQPPAPEAPEKAKFLQRKIAEAEKTHPEQSTARDASVQIPVGQHNSDRDAIGEIGDNQNSVSSPGFRGINNMNIFELRQFIRDNKNDKLRRILIQEAHSTDLEFVLNVKPESLIRKIALQLAG